MGRTMEILYEGMKMAEDGDLEQSDLCAIWMKMNILQPNQRWRKLSDRAFIEKSAQGEEVRRLSALNGSDEDIVISYYPFVIGKHKSLADYMLLKDTVSHFPHKIRAGQQQLYYNRP